MHSGWVVCGGVPVVLGGGAAGTPHTCVSRLHMALYSTRRFLVLQHRIICTPIPSLPLVSDVILLITPNALSYSPAGRSSLLLAAGRGGYNSLTESYFTQSNLFHGL